MDNLYNDADKIPAPVNSDLAGSERPERTTDNITPPPDVGDIIKPPEPYVPKIPPAASQGWYKQLTDENTNGISKVGTPLGNAAIYAMVAHNPLQRPEEIKKPQARPQPVYNQPPVTNPMPQRTRMFNYNPYQMRSAGMY